MVKFTILSKPIFSIVKDEEGNYYATKEHEPRFCLIGPSIMEAAEQAVNALQFQKDARQ